MAGKRILVILFVALLALPLLAAEKLTLDGSTTVGPLAKAYAEYYMKHNPGVKVEVSESGSGNGAKAIINGTADIGNMSRFMKPAEFSAAVEKGNFPVAHCVALDGLAIIVHKTNRIADLTMSQIHDIYTGQITNWKEVGGSDKPIVLISRESNSGTLDTFKHFIMKKDAISSKAESQGSNGAVKQSVKSTEGAIGFVGLGFIDSSIKAVTVGGSKASERNVKNGSYPIGRPLFMFTNGYPAIGSHIFNFINLTFSKDGEKLVKEAGYIPVTEYK